MTLEDIENEFAALHKEIDTLRQKLAEAEARLAGRVDSIGDYAGATEYRVKQLVITTDRRLQALEKQGT